MVRLTFQREGTERRRDRVAMESFYYTAMQQAIQAPIDHVKKATALRQLKAKIVRLHSQENQRILLANGESDKIIGEEVSVHQYIKALRREKARTINRIRDEEGNIHTTSAAILPTFTDHMRRKYDEIPCSTNDTKKMLCCGIKELPPEAESILERPITIEELHQAVTAGKARKAPGCDGISSEFLQGTWEVIKHETNDIINTMYFEDTLTDTQKRGVIVCIPKTPHPISPNEYRPLTLLNTDYELLAILLSKRLRPWLNCILRGSQYCGRQGYTIFDAVATVRDVITHSNNTQSPLCIVTIDFQEAFDNISHTYLYATL